MFIDMFANSRVSEETASWIRKEADKLSKLIAKRCLENIAMWDLSRLKEKDLDEMEAVFLRWKSGEGEKMEDYWRERQRCLLKERWESREGVAETDYHMKMVERGGSTLKGGERG